MFSYFCADKMTSSSSFMAEKMTPKPVAFKYQGAPKKLWFQDEHTEIWDTKLGHIDYNTFLTIYKKLNARSTMTSTFIRSGLVNATSHPTSVQSSKLIMTLA